MPTQRIAVRIPRNQTDPDAQAFITAAGITDTTQKSAINTLVVNLKSYGIWTKMKALYPMVGGTAASHKFNLKDPRDLAAAYRLTFNGGWTHSANGALPNGTNAFADTFLNAQTIVNTTNHLSYYSRTLTVGSQVEIGVYDGSTIYNQIRAASNYYAGSTGGGAFTTTTDARGFWLGTKRSSNDRELYFNGASQNTITVNDTNNLPNGNIYLGARKVLPNSVDFYSNKQCAFASIGDGLTDTEAANYYTAVQAFQTTLGRSIGTQTVSDADAQAFVTAADITDQVQATAINNLVVGLKADGLWTKMKAVYPFVGGTNTSNSYNLRNTAQYQISWGGSVTSNSNGVTFGVNGYGNTGLNPTTALTLNDTHLSFYSRTDGAGGIDIGATAASDVRNLFIAQSYVGNFYADSYSSTSRFTLPVQTKGLLTISRTAANSYKAFKNATQIGTTITTSVGTLPNWNIFLGATNRDGVPTNPTAYSARNQAFASIGDGLTDTDVTNLNNRVTTFQTTLGRQV